MDRIFIKDLCVPCIIGVGEKERKKKQDVIINIVLSLDLRKAGKSDRFQDAVDYHDLERKIIRLIRNSKYKLQEALAEAVASVCLTDKRVKAVQVRVEKPSASEHAKSIGVEIVRERKV